MYHIILIFIIRHCHSIVLTISITSTRAPLTMNARNAKGRAGVGHRRIGSTKRATGDARAATTARRYRKPLHVSGAVHKNPRGNNSSGHSSYVTKAALCTRTARHSTLHTSAAHNGPGMTPVAAHEGKQQS